MFSMLHNKSLIYIESTFSYNEMTCAEPEQKLRQFEWILTKTPLIQEINRYVQYVIGYIAPRCKSWNRNRNRYNNQNRNRFLQSANHNSLDSLPNRQQNLAPP